MIPQAALDQASRFCLDNGMRLLQSYRLHDTDEGHVERLLGLAEIDSGHWLDIGSGFGEFAQLALRVRTDLQFTLLNYNQFQLDHTPIHLARVRSDMHALPFATGSFHGVLFLYALCHAEHPIAALNEAARIVRPGGHLVVYDYTGIDGDTQRTWDQLHARFYERQMLEALGALSGWRTVKCLYPSGAERVFNEHPAFADLRATIWKAVRA